MKIKIIELEKIIVKIFSKKYSKKESEKIKETIMFAELSGKKSHGIIRIPELMENVTENFVKLYTKPWNKSDMKQ